jgi:hypothetical protein
VLFRQLQDEVISLRFDESRRASVKNWINLSYAAIWAMHDWHFKHVKGVNLSVTAGDNTPTMPSDFAKAEGLYDANGNRIGFLDEATFNDSYLDPTISRGTVGEYSVIDRELWLGPTPASTATFTLSYERRLAHIDGSSGLIAAGVMVNDSDSPIWDAEYDYVLVYDAALRGGSLLGDLDVSSLQAQRDEILAVMAQDLVGGEDDERLLAWGDIFTVG